MIGFVAPNSGCLEGEAAASGSAIFKNTGRNVGNLAFWHTARRLFADPVIHLNWSSRPKKGAEKPSVLFIPAANFIGAHTDLKLLAEMIRAFDVPVVVIGLGAQSERNDVMPTVPEGTVSFLKEAAKRTPFLSVRGPYSKTVCQHLGIENVAALGCPSVLMNADPGLGAKLEAAIAALEPGPVAVHAASTKGNVQSVERELYRYMRLYPGSQYIVQRPAEVFSAILREELSPEARTHLAGLATYLGLAGGAAAMIADLQMFGHVPTSIDSWRVYLRRFSCSINTRIHGTMVGIQSGVPSLCVAHDARTDELCRQLHVPSLSIAKFIEHRYDIKAMFKAAAFDGKAFEDGRRGAAERYVGLFRAVGVTPSAHLLSFCKPAAVTQPRAAA